LKFLVRRKEFEELQSLLVALEARVVELEERVKMIESHPVIQEILNWIKEEESFQ